MAIEEKTPQDLLKEIASTVMFAAEADTVEQVLQRIAHAARDLVRAKYAAIGVPDNQGGLRYFQVSGLSEKEIQRIAHPPLGKGLLGAIMHDREILSLPRMEDDARAVGFPEGHPVMTSLLGVPVQVGNQLFGMLYMTDREDGKPFDVQDEWLVETLGGYAALAIAGSELREKGRRLTLLEERQRIGMELHDGVIQSLYAIGMQLDIMRSTGQLEPKYLQSTIDGLNSVIEDIRSYIMNLKNNGADEKTIRQALYDIINRLYIPEGMHFQVEAPDHIPPFTPDDFESICFIVREALSNVMRHSDANHVLIRCWQEPPIFNIIIRDNGKGFNANEHYEGLGLHNIRERTKLHGGTIEIESQPGNGTTLTLHIPMT